MIVNTPDGQVNFPDSMSEDDVKGVLQKKYGAPATAPSMPAAMTYDPSDPNASWGSWALSKLHNAAVGGNLFNRVVQDSATFGGLDKAQSLVPGSPSVDQLRAQTEQSRKDIGYLAPVADVLGYAAGPGELKVGEGLSNLIGRGIVGRVGGSAAEGAGASVLGTAGHGDTDVGDLLKSAATGGTVGAVTGALPGGAGKRPTTPPTADLQSTASALYKPLESKVYQTPGVAKVVAQTGDNLSQGLQSKMSSSLSDQIDRINGILSKGTQTTASDIADFRSSLMNSARSDVDKTIAGQYLAALDKGVGSQTAADIAAANRASNIAKTSSDIEGWAAAPSKAPAAVQSALENSPNFYKTQPGLFDALSAIGKKSEDPSLLAKLRDFAVRSAVGGGLGYGAGYLMGGNPGQTAVEGAMTGVVAPHVIKAAGSIPIRNSLLAAQHLNATGMKVDPSVYTNMGLQVPGILARQGGYAAGASGAL